MCAVGTVVQPQPTFTCNSWNTLTARAVCFVRRLSFALLLRGFPAYCADLTRLGWIAGLLPSAFSPEYFKGELTPATTLKVEFLDLFARDYFLFSLLDFFEETSTGRRTNHLTYVPPYIPLALPHALINVPSLLWLA